MSKVVRLAPQPPAPEDQEERLLPAFPLRALQVGRELIFRSKREDRREERCKVSGILRANGGRWITKPGACPSDQSDRVRLDGELWRDTLSAGYVSNAGTWLLVQDEAAEA
jgi:hypothetical protein